MTAADSVLPAVASVPLRRLDPRRAAVVLAVAAALGIAGDALTTTLPERLDVAACLALVLLTIAVLVKAGVVELERDTRMLGAPALLLVVALVWRDSPPLFALNFLALLTLLALAVRVRGVSLASAEPYEYVLRLLLAGAGAAIGAPALLAGVDWNHLRRRGAPRRLTAAAIGVTAALPALIIFGLLFMSADPIFAAGVHTLFRFDAPALARHVASAGVLAWGAAGALYVLAARPAPAPFAARANGPAGIVEVGTALGLVAALFAAFVGVQLRYLFGGAALVARVSGLSYAEYARHGFFELLVVAALTLPLLLAADWLLDGRDAGAVRRFRQLAVVLLALLAVILASALQRMRLYTATYGLTEQRLYATAFMGWLVLVLGWLAVTVLRGRRERFAVGALVAGLCTIGALNLINPDAVIVRTNTARAVAGRNFDPHYTARLSADAVFAMLEALPTLPADDACAASAALVHRWAEGGKAARENTWNIARTEVRRLAAQGRIAPVAGCPTS